jgi:hydrogenase/urease accessory protein HupE
MPTDFHIWFQEGFQHILNKKDPFISLDHILYIIALCLSFDIRNWKKVLILITAFTIGHSITLYLTSLQVVSINTRLVEFCIPLTIAVTALLNIFQKQTDLNRLGIRYVLALFFGFIHGMAYGANSIGSLYEGAEAVWLVLAFNLGVELAQLIVVFVVMLFLFLLFSAIKSKKRLILACLSSIIFIYAVYLAIKNLP